MTLLIVVFMMPMAMAESDPTQELIDLIVNNYKDDISRETLEGKSIEEIFSLLDAHSVYYPKDKLDSLMKGAIQSPQKEYVGIGAKIYLSNGNVIISDILPDSPAEKSGLLPGDEILAVDGSLIQGKSLDSITSLITGLSCTDVQLGILRNSDKLDIIVTREPISTLDDDNVISVKELDNHLKYIDINSFKQGISLEFEKIIRSSTEDGTKGLIIDLRDNHGGVLSEVINICQLIVLKGPIVHIYNGDGREEDYQSVLEDEPFSMAVLVNEQSASASEILASAIKESGSGIIIGKTTYGKGTVQKVFKLQNGAYVKLTVGEYTTRNGNKIDGIGLEPDITINTPEYIETDKNKYKVWDINEDVKNVEVILSYLGYSIENVDNRYDEETERAVKQFQADRGLYPYGVCDFTTQRVLNNTLYEAVKDKDLYVDKAIIYLNGCE